MKIDISWLREWCDPQADDEALAERLTMAGLEVERIIPSDDGSGVLELALTPNRADCFSVRGVARELSVLFAADGGAQEGSAARKWPAVPAAGGAQRQLKLAAPEGCPRFAGRVIEGLAPAASTPDYIARRLLASGVRPLHLLVDITNYVMLEVGQPMHAYDIERLEGDLCARWAAPGEALALLDGAEVKLDSDVLVIADQRQAVAAAGIMGGIGSAVSGETDSVLLESAFFAPQAVAGRARRLGLQTEASLRFERGVDPAGQVHALEYATQLVLASAGGRPGPVIDSVDAAHLPQRPPVDLRRDRLAAILGLTLADADVAAILSGLGMQVRSLDRGWRVTPPSFRFDVSREADLVEEVARIHGYGNIPETPARLSARPAPATEQRIDPDRIRALLIDRGYSECVNYSFVDRQAHQAFHPGEPRLELSNPLSGELALLRHSLWPGLLRNCQANRDRGTERLRLFEIGNCFSGEQANIVEKEWLAGLLAGDCLPEQWGTQRRLADFHDGRGDVEAVLALGGLASGFRYEAAEHPVLRPGRSLKVVRGGQTIGWLGELHPRLAHGAAAPGLFALELDAICESRPAAAAAISRFPSVRRDLSLLSPKAVAVGEMLSLVRAEGGGLLRDVVVFDLYEGGKSLPPDTKSIGLGLIFQSISRTLTDPEVESAVASLISLLGSRFGVSVRA